jgi:hypothetical protein
MDLNTFHDFLGYYAKVRGRTKLIISKIPKDKIDWTYREGKFSFADRIEGKRSLYWLFNLHSEI